MSRDLAQEEIYVSSGGKIPLKWTAPEAFRYRKYSTASDVWSYGCVIYEIWSLGMKPFGSEMNNQVCTSHIPTVQDPPTEKVAMAQFTVTNDSTSNTQPGNA